MILKDSCYRFENLKLKHGVYTKPYNFNRQKLDESVIEKNYDHVKKDLDVNFVALVWQQHTDKIKIVTEENKDIEEIADGMITNLKGIALGIKIADCQSIFLVDEENEVIANIHSGWKGTVLKILKNAVNLMNKNYNTDISKIKAYINPSILGCHFEVDEDVYLAFKNSFKELDVDNYTTYEHHINKYYIDQEQLNKDYLITLGLKEENITLSSICTVCNNETIHSYRADKELEGRNVAVISL